MSDKIFTTGSGNIFLDLGFSDEEAANLTMKSYLFGVLQKAVTDTVKKSTQAEVAARMGVDQPIVSKILNDKMSGFSIERIATYLTRLQYDICLKAQPAPKGRKTGRVIDDREFIIA